MWNIDLTLVDVARVSRDAYAEAFRRVTGRPLVALPQLAGAGDSEIFFESLALNEVPAPGGPLRGGGPASQASRAARGEPAGQGGGATQAGWAGRAGRDRHGSEPAGQGEGATHGSEPAGQNGGAASGGAECLHDEPGTDLLAAYTAELAAAFAVRRDLLISRGRLLPGARQALAAVAALPGSIQSVLTGTIKSNATEKLRAFGLLRYLDLDIGGFGSDAYPRGALLLRSRGLAEEKYGIRLSADATVYLADSVRDVEAALIGGTHCIGVASGRSTVADLRAAGASLVLTDLSDTAAVVAAIEKLTGPA